MPQDVKSLLAEMQADGRFQFLLQLLKESRPSIPEYDEKNDNTEIWKARSAQRRGFDLCMKVLAINVSDLEKIK